LRRAEAGIIRLFGTSATPFAFAQHTVDFVVEMEAVYRSVAGFDGRRRAFPSEGKGNVARMIPAVDVAINLLLSVMVILLHLQVKTAAMKSPAQYICSWARIAGVASPFHHNRSGWGCRGVS